MCSVTWQDALKFFFPVGWTAFAVIAAIVYMTVPSPPRFAPAFVALSTCATSLACAAEISINWRSEHYVLSLAPSEVAPSEMRSLFGRMIAAFVVLLGFFVAFCYFLIAPSMVDEPVCGHESCGADAAWTGIATVFAAVWLFLIVLVRRRLGATTRTAAFTSATASAGQNDEDDADEAA